jgi:hypothetical protein
MRLKTSSSATFYGLMTKHSDKEHYRFKLRYLVSPVLTRFAVSCLHLLFEAFMTSRSCFTDSFCQECLGETSRMHDFAPKVSGQISTCIGFSRTGKCSVVATSDILVFVSCMWNWGSIRSYCLENSLWKRLWILRTTDYVMCVWYHVPFNTCS